MSEWIEWTGNECPVAPDVLVNLRVDATPLDARPRAYLAGEVQWDNSRRRVKLLAYRVVKSQ